MVSVEKPEQDRGKAKLQAVCVKWGSKYGPDAVNRLYRAVSGDCSVSFRFCCVTDQVSGDYDAGIDLIPFPRFSLPFDRMERGCRLKLAVFAPGILDNGVPAILLDLDTLVMGHLARIGEQLSEAPELY